MIVGSTILSLFVAKGNCCNNLHITGNRNPRPYIQTVSLLHIDRIICVVAGFEFLKYKK